MKKIFVILIGCMFLSTVVVGIVGSKGTDEYTFKIRRFIETRVTIPVYTEHGLEQLPGGRGKPGVYVTITNPNDGDVVSGIVTITIDSNDNPSILIDGTTVGKGLSYIWDTTTYSDGSHTIKATAKGHTDTVVVTVNNNGNLPPTVEIITPSDGAVVSGTVSIVVDANDNEDGVLTPDIYIDGSYVASGSSYSWDTTSYLDGSHTIYAEATDSGGLTGLDSITVTVDNSGDGDGVVEKWALCIGISDYRGKINDLNYCDDDAKDWANFLTSMGYNVVTLLDRKATADAIETKINELLVNEDADDYVVFTYSGHGTKYGSYGSCMISTDMVYITHGWLEAQFSSADSSHIYFTFDACEIGDFGGIITNGRVGAFASNNEYSYDGTNNMKNGVFTYYQMEGWNYYDNFEDDAAYAITEMGNWASQYGVDVDPFYLDYYNDYTVGDMTP